MAGRQGPPAQYRAAWALGGASLLLLLALGAYLAPLQPNIVVLQFSFTPAAFAEVLAQWRPEGVLRYRLQLLMDYALLLCYGTFGYVAARAWRVARWLMPLAALCDALENALHWHLSAPLTEGAAHLSPWLYVAAGVSATFKWLLLGAFLLVWLRRMRGRD